MDVYWSVHYFDSLKVISNESMDFNDSKEFDDPQVIDDPKRISIGSMSLIIQKFKVNTSIFDGRFFFLY